MKIPSKVFDWCVRIFVFFYPVIWLPGISQKSVQLLFFNYGAIFLFALSLFSHRKREVNNYFLGSLIIMCGIYSLIIHPKGFNLEFLNTVFAVMIYYAVVSNVSSYRVIVIPFVCVLFFNLIFSMMQIFGHDLIYIPDSALSQISFHLDKCGVMGRNYHFGFYTAIVAPALLSVSAWFLIPVIAALIISKSFIAIGAGLFFCGLYYSRKRLWLLISFLLLSVATIGATVYSYFYVIADKISFRFPIWIFVLREALVNPFIGKGLGNFDYYLTGKTIDGILFLSSYSQYFKAFFEIGFFPVLLVLSGLILYIKKTYTSKVFFCLCSLMSAASIMFFHEIFMFPRLAITVVLILAIYEIRNKEDCDDCYSL